MIAAALGRGGVAAIALEQLAAARRRAADLEASLRAWAVAVAVAPLPDEPAAGGPVDLRCVMRAAVVLWDTLGARINELEDLLRERERAPEPARMAPL